MHAAVTFDRLHSLKVAPAADFALDFTFAAPAAITVAVASPMCGRQARIDRC
jgi:hypothetical protein